MDRENETLKQEQLFLTDKGSDNEVSEIDTHLSGVNTIGGGTPAHEKVAVNKGVGDVLLILQLDFRVGHQFPE